MKSVLTFIGGLAVAFGLTCYRGLLLSTMWSWFVVATFKGVQPLGIASAIGLSMLVAVVTHQKNRTEEAQDFAKTFTENFVKVTAYFAIAWIITKFM